MAKKISNFLQRCASPEQPRGASMTEGMRTTVSRHQARSHHSLPDELPHWREAYGSVRSIRRNKKMTARTLWPTALEIANDRIPHFVLNRILLDAPALRMSNSERFIAPVEIA